MNKFLNGTLYVMAVATLVFAASSAWTAFAIPQADSPNQYSTAQYGDGMMPGRGTTTTATTNTAPSDATVSGTSTSWDGTPSDLSPDESTAPKSADGSVLRPGVTDPATSSAGSSAVHVQ